MARRPLVRPRRNGGAPGLAVVRLLFGAGVDTTVGLLSNGLVALLGNPRQAELLRADPGLAEATVTEVLRYDSPTQVIVRVAGPGAVIAGHPVPENGTVFALTGAAHRDPEQFGDPDTFDITRTGTSVLSFSGGIHYCVGAPLARIEARIVLSVLLDRTASITLDPERAPQWVESLIVRRHEELPIRLVAR